MATYHQERPKKRPKLGYSSDIVKIELYDGTTIAVHEDLVCKESEFFAAACSQRWNNTLEKKVELTDCHTNVVAAFVHWVYTGCIDVSLNEEQLKMEGVPLEESTLHALLHLYILADKVDARRLRNDLIDATLSEADEASSIPGNATVCYAFERLPTSSELLRVYTQMFLDYRPKDQEIDGGEWPLPVLKEVAKRYVRDNEVPQGWKLGNGYSESESGSDEDSENESESDTKITWKDRADYHEAE